MSPLVDHRLKKLDVVAPLRVARDQAAEEVLAWIAAAVVVVGFLLAFGHAIGWPQPDWHVEGRVVDVERGRDEARVTFEGRGDGRIVEWTDSVAESEWVVGDEISGWVLDGRFHREEEFPLGNPAGLLFTMAAGALTAWPLRRLAAIAIALGDLRRGRHHPRGGYVAVAATPHGHALRSVLAVWWDDPVDGDGLAPPDDHFVVDGGPKTEDLDLTVWEAWVDAGRFWWTKPRWIAVRDGVFVPHRRSLSRPGRLFRGAQGLVPVPLESTRAEDGDKKSPGFLRMLPWRLAAAAALACGSALVIEPGPPVRWIGGL